MCHLTHVWYLKFAHLRMSTMLYQQICINFKTLNFPMNVVNIYYFSPN